MENHIQVNDQSQKGAWKELNAEAVSLCRQGSYDSAINVAKTALDIAEQTLGLMHLEAATSMETLAVCYCAQDEHAQTIENYRQIDLAVPLYELSLDVREKALGSQHPLLLNGLEKLSVHCYSSGEYSKGILVGRRILEIREKTLGLDHPDTVTAMIQLANLYEESKQFEFAEPIYQRAEAVLEKVSVLNHLNYAFAFDMIVNFYLNHDQVAKAEAHCLRALEIREKASVSNQHELAFTLEQLVILYLAQGQFAKAEPICKRSLEIKAKLLRPDAPYVTFKFNKIHPVEQSPDWEHRMKRFEDKASLLWSILYCQNTVEPVPVTERDFAAKAVIEEIWEKKRLNEIDGKAAVDGGGSAAFSKEI